MVSLKLHVSIHVSSSGIDTKGKNATFGLAALDRIEQGLVFQIADENMFFVFGQIGVVNTVARHVDFFRAQKKDNCFRSVFQILRISVGHNGQTFTG